MKPDKFISKVEKNVFLDGTKAAAAELQWEYHWLKQQQQMALAEPKYLREWQTHKY